MEVPQTEKTEKFLYGTIKNNGESSYVKFDGSDFLTPITSAMGYEDGDRVMVMMKDHRAIVTSNMTSPGVSQKYVKENCASFDMVSAINARIDILDAGVVKTSELDAAIANIGYLKSDYADLKYASISSLNASNAEIENLKSTTIKTTELSAEVAKLGYASVKDLEVTTAKIDNLTSKAITTDNLTAETAKLGYLTANQADIRYLTVSTADAKFLHADMSDMDIAKIQTLFATAGIISDMTIKDGHITGELSGIKVSANDISAGRLDAATIEVVNLNAANITVGTINGTQIATGAIDLTKLGSDVTDKLSDTEEDVAKAVEDAKKAITDSATAQSTANSATSTANSALSTANSATSTANAANSLASTAKSTADSANSSAANAVNIANSISVGGRNLLPIKIWENGHWWGNSTDSNYKRTNITFPAGTYTFTKYKDISEYSGNNFPFVFIKYDNETNAGDSNNCVPSNVYAGTQTFNMAYPFRVYVQANITWEKLNLILKSVKLEKGNKATDWTPAPEDVDSSIDTASIKNWCYDGNLAWMNGAKIYANTIVSDAIATDAITAVKIKAGAITADKLAANSVTAGKIAANAVTAGTIAAGSITTDKLSANAVSADKIAANAVTADKILAKSITATKIAAGTITSDEIASGTIKAANINVTDLVGNSAFINSLKSNTVIVGLQNDINGISVGGRNLIRNSHKQPMTYTYPSSGFQDHCFGVTPIVLNGDTYTLSFWAKSTVSGDEIVTHFYNPSNNTGLKGSQGQSGYQVDGYCVFTLSTTLTKYWVTYNIPKGGNTLKSFIVPRMFAGKGSGIVTIQYEKLEEGNKATDWTPAPEDVDSLISAAQSTANSANTLAGTANSAAGAAQTTANTALTTANNAKKNVYAKYGAGAINNQYCQLADITVTTQHGDGPIKITTQSRILGTAEICLNIYSSNVNSPSFNVDNTSNYINSGNFRAWIAQDSSNAKVFHLYVNAGNWYDNLVVTDYTNSSAHTLTWVCKTVDSLPNNAKELQRTIGMGRWCYNNDITYINGGKIYTGTVTADKLAANSVTADKILAGAITADKLAANSVTADKILAEAITADKLAANSVTTDKILAEAITADKIATHSITADKLAVGSITANELSVIGGLNVTDAKLYNDFFVLEKKSNGIDFIVKDADSAELFTIKTEHPATSSMWNEFMVNNFNQISFTGDDIYLNGSVYVNDVNLSNVYTGGGGLFNTSTALLINGNALNSKWAQLIIEYNGSCFGIRNDGGNTYLMNGNTNGWTNYCSFNTNGNWGFPGNATLPGTLTAGALFSTGGICLAGRTNAQTTAKPNAYIDSAGNVWKSSTTSSKRFKEDVKPVENMELNPENLYDIDVVQFKYKKGHFTNKEDPRYRKDMIGFIAENVYEHYPMAADYHIGDDGNVVCDGWNEQYLIPAMLKLIQDQHKRILELEKGIQNG